VTDGWPAWAVEPVQLSEWDPAWLVRGAVLAADLEEQLAGWLEGSIEHVGSTAVPGLTAKPVVDLLAPVASLAVGVPVDEVLAAGGWHLVPPELDQRSWRRMYVLADADRRVAHLHLVETSHPRRREMVGFRDRLRRDPALAAAYARVKRSAAAAHHDDREAYTQAKGTFIDDVVGDPT
jgi:GrpB-like predicted nucleotidyltransferase (UPF0157 family)